MTPMLRRYQMQYEGTRPVVRPPSTYTMPLHTPRDYARAAAHPHVGSAPVLLDHAQYFVFLSQLAEGIWQVLGEHARLYIQIWGSCWGTMPEALLRPQVLMGSHLYREAAFQAERGETPVVWTSDRIRRDLYYPADNSLMCAVWPRSQGSAVRALLARSWPEHAVRIANG